MELCALFWERTLFPEDQFRRNVQGIPSVLGLEMELFHIPFERYNSEVNNETKRQYSDSGLYPEGMPCTTSFLENMPFCILEDSNS